MLKGQSRRSRYILSPLDVGFLYFPVGAHLNRAISPTGLPGLVSQLTYLFCRQRIQMHFPKVDFAIGIAAAS